ncbi:trehalose-phosphatase [Spirillospora sp. CA-142024]|uniref:trehalose-phosphatase n=1 Tax=Spirillospora sp. CA-142024 TaxID=3240036 RepID=UPI003D9048AA
MTKESGASGDQLFSFQTKEGEKAMEAFEQDPQHAVVVEDWDGNKAPTVKFPDMPFVDPRYRGLYEQLVEQIGAAGLLTGRSVGQIRQFGQEYGWENGLLVPGTHMIGQFGCEYWHHGRLTVPVARPSKFDMVVEELPGVLADAGVTSPSIEKVKSHFVAGHYDAGTDEETVARVVSGCTALAKRASTPESRLVCHAGNSVVEIGPAGVNKENSLAWFVCSLPFLPSVVYFSGDGEQDERAFRALNWLRKQGVPVIKGGTSGSNGVFANKNVERQADLHLRGPQGNLAFMQWVCQLTA